MPYLRAPSRRSRPDTRTLATLLVAGHLYLSLQADILTRRRLVVAWEEEDWEEGSGVVRVEEENSLEEGLEEGVVGAYAGGNEALEALKV